MAKKILFTAEPQFELEWAVLRGTFSPFMLSNYLNADVSLLYGLTG